MPKMKSHSGAKKRFRKTATGKLKARHAFSSHILEKKSPKYKRKLGEPVSIAKAEPTADAGDGRGGDARPRFAPLDAPAGTDVPLLYGGRFRRARRDAR